ncbi:MAG: glycoside hydrolase family 31 protein [Myxococcota bacterium]
MHYKRPSKFISDFFILLILVSFLTISCSDSNDNITDIIETGDTFSPDTTDISVIADTGDFVEDIQLVSGDSKLLVNRVEREISLFHKEKNILTFNFDGIMLGIVKNVDDEYNYDPWPIVNEDKNYTPPEGFKWIKISDIAFISTGDSDVEIKLIFETNRIATLKVKKSAENRFLFEIIPDERSVRNIAYYRLDASVSKDEAFYGLGAYLDDVNQRGKRRAMQFEIDNTESGYNEAHVPVPFLLSTGGWGWFIESTHLGAYDVASSKGDIVSAVFGTGVFSRDGIRFYLFSEDKPIDLIKHYYEVTSFPVLPARWAIGPLLWRDENRDQGEVENDINQMRLLDLAHTAIWIDRPYATAVNTFDFNKEQFPDPVSMINKVHSLGFRIGLWHTPYLEKATGELLTYAESHNFFPPQTGLILNRWGKPIDFTNPEAYRWWQENLKKYRDMGIAGYKLDYAEDIVPGISGARNKWKFYDGSDERTMHRGYTLLYHKVYSEILPEDGGFLLCRTGKYGSQKYTYIIWPGDLDANFAHHKEEVIEKNGNKFIAVGGLPASMIYGLNLAVSGFPFYGADTGGYRHSPPDKELFTRWFEQTALSSVMQIGNSASTVAWEEDSSTGYDSEMLSWYRIYTRLHLRLFPYIWTYAENIKKTAHPIQRPFGIMHPEMNIHIWDQYYFGDYLLVAPVLKRDQRERDVILPEGNWIDFFDRTLYYGGRTITVAAPLGKLPLFIKENAIIPLLRPTIDTYSATDRPELVDSYSTTPGVLYTIIFPKTESEFTLFDNTKISHKTTSDKIVITAQKGDEFKYGFLLEVLNIEAKPSMIKDKDGNILEEKNSISDLEAAESGYHFEIGSHILYIKINEGSVEISR